MFLFIKIDQAKNQLLCSTEFVGIGELVELWQTGKATPPQIGGKVLRKVADPNLFEVRWAYESQDFVGKQYSLAEDCVFRVMMKKMSGTRRRKFAQVEKKIVDTEHDGDFKETKVVKAKTGSVRKRPTKTKKKKKKGKQ